MTVRERTLGVWGSLRGRSGLWEKPGVKRCASLAVHFALGFVTGTVQVFDELGPFGVAMTARCGAGPGGLFCLLGAAAGYAVSGGLNRALRYVAALLLVFTAAFVFRETSLPRRRWFLPVAAAGAMLATGLLNRYDSLGEVKTLLSLATELLLCAVSAYLFTLALGTERLEKEEEELRRRAGGILLLCCLQMSLQRVSVGGLLSPGRLLAVFTVMTAAFGGGPAAGAAAGVIFGLAADMAGGGAAFFTMCYGFAGLLSGALSRLGRPTFALSYLLVTALVVLWSPAETGAAALWETPAAALVFLALPARSLSSALALVRQPAPGSGERGLRRYTARRTGELADAFRALYDAVQRSAESEQNDADVATVYDRAAESVCSACKNKGFCWHRDYVDTLSILNDATAVMRDKGRLSPEDLPPRFRERCLAAEPFLAAVNMELRALQYRRQLRARLQENRLAAYGQYRYLANVLDALSGELRNAGGSDALAERRLQRYLTSRDIEAETAVFRDQSGRLRAVIEGARLPQLYRETDYMDRISAALGVRMCRPAAVNREEERLVLLEAEPLAVSVGVAAVKKEGEHVSGDRGTYFKTEQGVLCVLLSDGMGSGEQAARESISAVRILERFLRAGVEPGTAMKLLNSVMLLKNGEGWGYATVDLMCVDLFSGQTGFYKYGAAPSYIRSGRSVRRVRGVSMAAGILAGEGETPDVVRMRLRPGGVALIASDGVVTRESDGWLREMLLSFEGNDAREFARSVIRQAGRQYGYNDDMTVLVVRVEERK